MNLDAEIVGGQNRWDTWIYPGMQEGNLNIRNACGITATVCRVIIELDAKEAFGKSLNLEN